MKNKYIFPIETLSLPDRGSRFFLANQITQHVIVQPFDGDTSSRLLDRAVVNKGTVVPQTMWSPHTVTDKRQHVEEAVLQSPIFFEGWDGMLGLSLEASATGRCHGLRRAQEFAPLGQKSTTHIRIVVCVVFRSIPKSHSLNLLSIQWPGYQDFKRQVQLRDETSEHNPITISRFAHHIGRSVEAFFKVKSSDLPTTTTVLSFLISYQSCEPDPGSTDSRREQWQIGPHGIQRSDIIVIGAIHVSAGSWMPILQLSRYIL